MAHLHRFHIPPDTTSTSAISLSQEEAHHAIHVVRLKAGDPVMLFDGRGREIEGAVERITHREAIIQPHQERRFPPPPVRLTIVQAWLLREKSIEYLIQHGTEVGISRFLFFRARHSEKTPRLNPKWERHAIEACKQCGRAWLPSFEVAAGLEEALATVGGRILIATQSRSPVSIAEALTGAVDPDVALIVGPEGDFAERELELAAERGAIPISLGDATYRSEVASTLAASLLLYESGALGPK